ncbi:unnamed protein product, partial [marine sediment metagenome]
MSGAEDRRMVTETITKTNEMVAFDDYLRFGTDDESPKRDTSRRAYLWTAELFTRFLNGRELTPDLAREFIKELTAQVLISQMSVNLGRR